MRAVMHLESVDICADHFPTRDKYPFNLPTLRSTSRLTFESAVSFFVGENGTGKSTLLRAITRRCGIHIWANPDSRRVELNPYEEQLSRFLAVGWVNAPAPGSFFSSEHFRYFSERVEDWAGADPALFRRFGGKSLLAQSHGQSLMSFFASRYRLEGLYFLDEPETALSPRRQIELTRLLAEMGAAGHAQFVVATHSPILMSCPGAVIFSFDHAPVAPVVYEETDHFRIWRDFMANPEGCLAARPKDEGRQPGRRLL